MPQQCYIFRCDDSLLSIALGTSPFCRKAAGLR